jgi:DNA-binding response OmpR family regulator
MKKILVAEDDKYLANAYRVKLVKSGFEIKIASDGVEALTILKDFTPDLILLDLVMPIKDGFTTLQEIKNDSKLKTIPVIIASNLGQKEDIDRGIALGAVDYIVKSDMSLEDIITKVNTVLT